MSKIQANSINIYYEQGGSGPPLLFISGSGGDLRNKPNQFDSPLASSYELLCYDQRGLGQTEKPAGEYTMADYADDAAALMQALGYEQLPVVGVSFGGMVAQELMLRHPQRVSAAVLACTSAGGDGGASYPLHELHDMAPEERVVAHLKVADLRHTDAWIEENPQAWAKRIALSMRAPQSEGDERGAYQQLQARMHHDTFARLPTIDVPVLLAGGEHDGIAPPVNMQRMHEQIPGSELRLFNGGHMFLIQDKAAYPAIIEWLAQHT